MSKSTKRERAKAMREYERRLAWERAQEAKRRRRNVIAGSITAGVLVIALVGWAIVAASSTNDTAATGATATPEITQQQPPATQEAPPAGQNQGNVPPASDAESRTWTGTISTSVGDLQIKLDGKAAPQAVASFVSLAQKGFYNDTTCHRLTTSKQFEVLQCGDPDGNGSGGPGYSFGPIENAPTDGLYPKGTIAMARQGGNAYSNGSQFFIVYGDTVIPNDAAGGYTVFGEVSKGIDVIEKVGADGTKQGTADGEPKTTVTIKGVSVK